MSKTNFWKSDSASPTFYKKTDTYNIMKILKHAINAINTAELEQREVLIQQYSDALSQAACALCTARNHEQYGRFLLTIDPHRYENVLGQGAFHDPAILQYQINPAKIKQFLESVRPIDPQAKNNS